MLLLDKKTKAVVFFHQAGGGQSWAEHARHTGRAECCHWCGHADAGYERVLWQCLKLQDPAKLTMAHALEHRICPLLLRRCIMTEGLDWHQLGCRGMAEIERW
eukprot:6471551-Amphidinium_carterae.2